MVGELLLVGHELALARRHALHHGALGPALWPVALAEALLHVWVLIATAEITPCQTSVVVCRISYSSEATHVDYSDRQTTTINTAHYVTLHNYNTVKL